MCKAGKESFPSALFRLGIALQERCGSESRAGEQGPACGTAHQYRPVCRKESSNRSVSTGGRKRSHSNKMQPQRFRRDYRKISMCIPSGYCLRRMWNIHP